MAHNGRPYRLDTGARFGASGCLQVCRVPRDACRVTRPGESSDSACRVPRAASVPRARVRRSKPLESPYPSYPTWEGPTGPQAGAYGF
jgi:hypothetical protein